MSPQETTIKKNSARDLRLVTVGQGVSLVGDAITTLALPIVAVDLLNADSLGTGLLGAASTVAYLVIGLQAGVWIDRSSRRAFLIAADAARVLLLFAVPAAYSMAFHPTRRTRSTLLWMLSTKMLPPVGVLIPIYLLFRTLGLLDTRIGLTVIYMLMNLPIVVWMLYTFFKEVPHDILEAGRMDGANQRDEIRHLLLPLAMPGIASTGLDVVDIGAVTTPMTYYVAATRGQHGCTSGIQVTGSHNPKDWNGFKMVLAGRAIYGEEIQGLRKRIEAEDYVSAKGQIGRAHV